MNIRLLSLDELLAVSDFITVHLPKNKETLGLIGDEALRKVKPTVRIINAARGGIVDEQALATAITEGRVAGAGIDVYAKEPCTDSPLFAFEQVVATPHLGASTDEAQEKAGIAVAKSVRLALAGELVPDAVNVQGGAIAEDVRPGLPLTEKLGRILTALAGELPATVTVEVRGEITENDVSVLELSALKGVFTDVVEDAVSYVNAPLFAKERGLEIALVTDPDSPDHRNLVTVRGTLADGERRLGERHAGRSSRRPRRSSRSTATTWTSALADHLAFLRYEDRPGVVGVVGRILGDAGVNIAGMQVARDAKGGHALVALTVDTAIPPAVLAGIASDVGAEYARIVDLDD